MGKFIIDVSTVSFAILAAHVFLQPQLVTVIERTLSNKEMFLGPQSKYLRERGLGYETVLLDFRLRVWCE